MLYTEIEVQDSGVSIPILGYIKKDLNQTQCKQPCRKLSTGHFSSFSYLKSECVSEAEGSMFMKQVGRRKQSHQVPVLTRKKLSIKFLFFLSPAQEPLGPAGT